MWDEFESFLTKLIVLEQDSRSRQDAILNGSDKMCSSILQKFDPHPLPPTAKKMIPTSIGRNGELSSPRARPLYDDEAVEAAEKFIHTIDVKSRSTFLQHLMLTGKIFSLVLCFAFCIADPFLLPSISLSSQKSMLWKTLSLKRNTRSACQSPLQCGVTCQSLSH